jgi:hypothetical protein
MNAHPDIVAIGASSLFMGAAVDVSVTIRSPADDLA